MCHHCDLMSALHGQSAGQDITHMCAESMIFAFKFVRNTITLVSCEQPVAAYNVTIPNVCTGLNHVGGELFTHILKNVTADSMVKA